MMGRRAWMVGLAALVVVMCGVGFVVGDAGVEAEVENTGALIKEIERLKDHVGSLEGSLKAKEGILEKKDARIGSIVEELKTLKAESKEAALSKLKVELEAAVGKVSQLEEKLASVTNYLEKSRQYAEALKARAEKAEQTARDLAAKYENSQKSVSESRKRVQEAEKAARAAEATILDAEKKLRAHGLELTRVHSQWLPPWAATRMAILQSRAKAEWATRAKPHVDALYKQASDGVASAHAFVKPHIDTVTSTVGPEAQKHWKTVSDAVAPHVELVRSKSLKGYDVVRKDYLGKAQDFIRPHVDTVVDFSRPYVALVKEHTRPYVDQLATLSKPYVDQAWGSVNPYIEKVSPYYRDFVSAAVRRHEILQETVRSNLAKHDIASPLAVEELVWFFASALLALPVLTAFLLFSSAFAGKKTKPSKRSAGPGSSAPGAKHRRARKVDK